MMTVAKTSYFAAWNWCMRASMCADGTTFCPRCDLVETAGLDGKDVSVVGSHTRLDSVLIR